MAYICKKYKDAGTCKNCPHYRYDEDKGTMSCWASSDLKNTVYAVIETGDYNDGETLAESTLISVGDKETCTAAISELQVEAGKKYDLYDKCETYFWYEDGEGVKHSFAVRSQAYGKIII